MLFTSTISGPNSGFGYNGYNGYGFGAAALVQGTGFNCNSSICYAIGAANHALFQQLQQTLNQYAKLGLSAYTGQLTVDGFIGAQTVTAARAAAAAALLPSPGSTKEAIAASAPTLQAGLQAFLAGTTGTKPQIPITTSQPTSQPQPIPSSVVTPTSTNVRPVQTAMTPAAAAASLPAQVAVQPSPASAAAAATALAPPAKKVPLWVWITAGAVGVVVIGGVGYAVLHKPEAKPAAAKKAALARRRRRRR